MVSRFTRLRPRQSSRRSSRRTRFRPQPSRRPTSPLQLQLPLPLPLRLPPPSRPPRPASVRSATGPAGGARRRATGDFELEPRRVGGHRGRHDERARAAAIPHHDFTGTVTSTGDILVTGSIDLPREPVVDGGAPTQLDESAPRPPARSGRPPGRLDRLAAGAARSRPSARTPRSRGMINAAPRRAATDAHRLIIVGERLAARESVGLCSSGLINAFDCATEVARPESPSGAL